MLTKFVFAIIVFVLAMAFLVDILQIAAIGIALMIGILVVIRLLFRRRRRTIHRHYYH